MTWQTTEQTTRPLFITFLALVLIIVGVLCFVVSKEAQAGGHPPEACRERPSASSYTALIGESITFTATFTDQDNDLKQCKWYIDGKRVEGEDQHLDGGEDSDSWSHSFSEMGDYEVKVNVYDESDNKDSLVWNIHVVKSKSDSASSAEEITAICCFGFGFLIVMGGFFLIPKSSQHRFQTNQTPSSDKIWIVSILIIISLILSILSLFLPWYYLQADLDELDGEEADVTYHMDDKLSKRVEYMEVNSGTISVDDTKTTDNSELKYHFPDTAASKNFTFALVIVQVVLILIALILVLLAGFFKAKISFSKVQVTMVLISLFSLLLVAVFTFSYAPYEGDEDDDEDEGVNVGYDTAGGWFHIEIKYSGDIVGEGEGGIASGYVVSLISLILFSVAFFLTLSRGYEPKQRIQNHCPHQPPYQFTRLYPPNQPQSQSSSYPRAPSSPPHTNHTTTKKSRENL